MNRERAAVLIVGACVEAWVLSELPLTGMRLWIAAGALTALVAVAAWYAGSEPRAKT